MRILIVDDEANIRKTTSMALEAMGYETDLAGDAKVAMQFLADDKYDAVLLDLRLGGEDGLDVLKQILDRYPGQEVLVFTAYSSVETAVEAMRRGARDYIAKPFTPEQLRQVLSQLSRTKRLEKQVAELESKLSSESPGIDLTTEEPEMQRVIDVAMKVAASKANLLILGENGTGKSVLARAIHENSPLRESAFVTVNCPCLSKELLSSELFGHVKGSFTGATSDTWGKVAAADGGTLFLDEIGDLPLEIQPKLLRLLQEREYERVGETKVRNANVRVIAASNRDLQQLVEEKTFREDLYYRLNVVSIVMPALRRRAGDLMRLASNYLQFFSTRGGKRMAGFTPKAESALRGYRWPGNLRELRNVVERAVILADGDKIDIHDLPEELQSREEAPHLEVGSNLPLDQLEREHIRRVIARARTFEDAAKVLGVDPATLYRKRKRWETDSPEPISQESSA